MKVKIVKPSKPTPLQALFAKPSEPDEEAEFKGLMFVEQLLTLMKQQGIKRKELAERMGVGPSRVTAMLNGSSNFTLETLIRAARAVGATVEQTLVPEGAKVRWLVYREDDVHAAFSSESSIKKVSGDFALGTDEIADHDDEAAA